MPGPIVGPNLADVRQGKATDQQAGGDDAALEAFIRRWQGREGGQERANYALFLSGLCDVLGVPQPAPPGRCSDPFPFPAASEEREREIRRIAEELDAHRKRQQVEQPHLTLTAMYNVLEKLRAGTTPNALNASDRCTFDDGLILILKELHDRLDAAVATAYGWPADLSDEEILARLVALNRERKAEEAQGQVRWLRPDYQVPRFATAAQRRERQIEAELVVVAGKEQKPSFPTADMAQTAAVLGALARMGFVATPDGGRTFLLHATA